MDADLLSPLLGRLIDRAKQAALEAGAGAGEAEGVALLLADDTVVAAGAALRGRTAPGRRPSGRWPRPAPAAATTIEAAAVAIAGVQRESLLPSAASQEALRTVDAALPVGGEGPRPLGGAAPERSARRVRMSAGPSGSGCSSAQPRPVGAARAAPQRRPAERARALRPGGLRAHRAAHLRPRGHGRGRSRVRGLSATADRWRLPADAGTRRA